MGRRTGLAALLVAAGLSYPAHAKPPPLAGPVKIEVAAYAIRAFDPRDPSRTGFGALTFRGGLELQSKQPHFGGLSAIRIAEDGRSLLALTDAGDWLTGTLRHEGQAPAGLGDAEMRPIIGPAGTSLAATGDQDSESLAIDGKTLFVGIERDNMILRFDTSAQGLGARGQAVPVPAEIKRLRFNSGLEAMVFAPKGHPLAGALIAVAERSPQAGASTIPGFLIGGPKPGAFQIARSKDFDITDAALLPGGDLLLLERFFSPLRGVAMRLRRFAATDLAPGATLEGTVLIEADMGYQVDNMEGLSVHRDPQSGEIVLTLVSDDNFSILQRTILLQFTYRE
jgi:hypothetical protein